MNTLMKKRLNLEYPNSIRNRLIFISARKQHILFSRITPPGIRYWSSLDRHCSLCTILSFSAILGTKFLLHGCAALAAANLSRFSLFKFLFRILHITPIMDGWDHVFSMQSFPTLPVGQTLGCLPVVFSVFCLLIVSLLHPGWIFSQFILFHILCFLELL